MPTGVYVRSEEYRQIMSHAMKGHSTTEEGRRKISEKLSGKSKSQSHKQKLSVAHKGMKKPWVTKRNNTMTGGKHWAYGTHHSAGETNPMWLGGSIDYQKKLALVRDSYTCQQCGFKEIEIMEVDHIKPKSEYPELACNLNNLMTLCPNCHRRKTIAEHKARVPWNKGKRIKELV